MSLREKRQGNGSHSIAKRPSLTTLTVRSGRRERKCATGSATGTSRSAAGSPS